MTNRRTNTSGRYEGGIFVHTHSSFVEITCATHMIQVGTVDFEAETRLDGNPEPNFNIQVDDESGLRQHNASFGCTAYNAVRPRHGGSSRNRDIIAKVTFENSNIHLKWDVGFIGKLIHEAGEARSKFKGNHEKR